MAEGNVALTKTWIDGEFTDDPDFSESDVVLGYRNRDIAIRRVPISQRTRKAGCSCQHYNNKEQVSQAAHAQASPIYDQTSGQGPFRLFDSRVIVAFCERNSSLSFT